MHNIRLYFHHLARGLLSVLSLVLLVGACLYSTFIWTRAYGSMEWVDMRVEGMVNHASRKPFVTRGLVPAVFSTVAPYLEPPLAPVHKALKEYPRTRPILAEFVKKNRIGSERRAAVFMTAVWTSLFLMGIGIVKFVRCFGDKSVRPWLIACATILIWPILMCVSRKIYFIYDPFTPTLFLWTLYALHKRHYFASLVGFIACMFNRETAVLLAPVFAFALIPGGGLKHKLQALLQSLRRSHSKKPLWILLGTILMVVATVATKYLLSTYLYTYSRGMPVESPYESTLFNPDYIINVLPEMTVVYALYYLVGVRYGTGFWSGKHSKLAPVLQAAVVMAGVHFVMGAFLGIANEIRQYSEFFAVGAVCVGAAAVRDRDVVRNLNGEASAPPGTQPVSGTSTRSARSWLRLWRIAYVGLNAAILVLIVYSLMKHWTRGYRIVRTPDRITLTESSPYSTFKRVGLIWHHSSNYIFDILRPAVFTVTPPRAATSVDLGLDGNDTYVVVIKSDQDTMWHTIYPNSKFGIQHHSVQAPPGLVREITISPFEGDDNFAVGHVLLR